MRSEVDYDMRRKGGREGGREGRREREREREREGVRERDSSCSPAWL